MRAVLACLLLTFAFPSVADTYQKLYETAGWSDQRANFQDALEQAQQRYKATLPTALFQVLQQNSSQRFAPQAVDSRAVTSLRSNLKNPHPALDFYQSVLGRKIVAAEVHASQRGQLAKYANGLPRIEAGSNRQLLIRHLAQALPASAAGAEVSLALAGVAADSLSQMMPGLLSGGQALSLLDSQRQRLIQQIDADMDNTLLHIYRNLSDAELEQYLTFAQSDVGQTYYQAALQAIRAGLAVGKGAGELQSQGGI
ncbi:DUF2059 domain-containing protein [Azomonas macrocytogenes]|uniref:DUF2059 domain-containing protein n=1 Tax=Azomonas macrocytogenes TaxID=69962 RepID=A0A839T474_AZOMA|nr:DUF2059 domain-containing protein [Azomonas macrocytogenes]MBB3104331.1 hypothetical protein [Azomonas macrocytogenes]